MMTAYLVFAALRDRKLDEAREVNVSTRAARASGARMFATAGQAATIGDLTRALIVQSANDAAIALAEAVAGDEEAFVAAMNAQAQRLGLAHTHFANATGLPAPEHYASARDMAALPPPLMPAFPQVFALYSQKEFTFNRITP